MARDTNRLANGLDIVCTSQRVPEPSQLDRYTLANVDAGPELSERIYTGDMSSVYTLNICLSRNAATKHPHDRLRAS